MACINEIIVYRHILNPTIATILIDTGESYLIEHGRSAEKQHKSGNPPIYTGLVGTDGILYGYNLMGKYLMTIRAALIKRR